VDWRRAVWRAVVVLGIAALARPASAHVDYVVDDPQDVASVVGFLVETLSTPENAVLVALGGIVPLVSAAAYLRARPFATDLAAFRARCGATWTWSPGCCGSASAILIAGAGPLSLDRRLAASPDGRSAPGTATGGS